MPCSLLFFSDDTCDSEQMVSHTSWSCPGGPEQSDSSWCSVFPASNILSLDDDDEWNGSGGSPANYWLSEEGKTGEDQGFILYLGCIKTVTGVSLKNTHNAHHHDRSTKKFRILGSATENGPWQELLVANDEDMERRRRAYGPGWLALVQDTPVQQLMFAKPTDVSFIKFELLEYYGHGGGLQYFAIGKASSRGNK